MEERNLRCIAAIDRHNVLKQQRYYIPPKSKVCQRHFELNAWNNINNFRSLSRFNANQIDEMVDLLRVQAMPENLIHDLSSEEMKIFTGLSRKDFDQLFEKIPSISSKFTNDITLAKNALYTYMLRLRTGQTLERISSYVKMSLTTVSRWIEIVRAVLIKEFVPTSMKSNWTREELILNTTELSRALYCDGNRNKVVLALDATYLYIQKSGNQDFQKDTYTDQKKRNFVKIMMCVTTNGKIIFTSGPHPAVHNDATIISKILNSNECPVFSVLQTGDVCIVDRGFRDCVNALKCKGLEVWMPEMIEKIQMATQKNSSIHNKPTSRD